MSAIPAAPAESTSATSAAGSNNPASPLGSGPPGADAPKEPTLSTAILTDRLRDALSGQQPSKTPEATPEGETSPPEGNADGSTTEEEQPAGLPREALAALAEERGRKRQLKEQLKEKDAELTQLRERLEKLEASEKAGPAKEAPPAPQGSAELNGLPLPEDLAAALSREASQKELLVWSQRRIRQLQAGISEGDASGAVAGILQDLKPANIELPNQEPEAVLAWLEAAQGQAQDALDDARVEAKILKQRTREQVAAAKAESDRLAAEWAPHMKDAESSQGKTAAVIRQYFPGLEKHPFGPRFIAAAVLGMDVLASKGAATNGNGHTNGAKPAPEAPRGAKLPGAATAVPPRVQEGEASSSSVFNQMLSAKSEHEREQLKDRWMKSVLAGK